MRRYVAVFLLLAACQSKNGDLLGSNKDKNSSISNPSNKSSSSDNLSEKNNDLNERNSDLSHDSLKNPGLFSIRSSNVSEIPENSDVIYFSYDSATISENAEKILQAKSDSLRNQSSKLLIKGYCDERGTEEYNLALGEKRAFAVKDSLMQNNVSEAKLATISYGEAEPAAIGANEEAYSKNRRVEFQTNP